MAHDTVIYNANIHTMDQSRPRAAWLHMRDGLILALGDGAAPDAETCIDAGGRLVLPGFQDAHIHLLNGGVDLLETAQQPDGYLNSHFSAVEPEKRFSNRSCSE